MVLLETLKANDVETTQEGRFFNGFEPAELTLDPHGALLGRSKEFAIKYQQFLPQEGFSLVLRQALDVTAQNETLQMAGFSYISLYFRQSKTTVAFDWHMVGTRQDRTREESKISVNPSVLRHSFASFNAQGSIKMEHNRPAEATAQAILFLSRHPAIAEEAKILSATRVSEAEKLAKFKNEHANYITGAILEQKLEAGRQRIRVIGFSALSPNPVQF